MRTSLFDYHLPPELIAQRPLRHRDASRLMVVDRERGGIAHRVFRELPALLDKEDCLVVNSSRVFPGRLHGVKSGSGGAVEILLLEKTGESRWRALARGAALKPGTRVEFEAGGLAGTVIDGPDAGKVTIRFSMPGRPGGVPDEVVFRHGSVPLPPYVKAGIRDPERYQTVYGKEEISAAAPTAGLHFTGELLDELRDRGIRVAELKLAVGLDTFSPVREERVEDHVMHSEWFEVGEECAASVNLCRGRVVAVGTTAMRALETAASRAPGRRVEPIKGRTDLFIRPGFTFRVVDVLVTNFHFPRSTLLMLVCAFGGTDLILEAYRQAVAMRYRFYSFGDAMMVM